jgi:hypothetical protein
MIICVADTTEAGSSNLNENLFPFNTYRINCNSFLRAVGSPGCGIKSPGVPRANQLPFLNHSLGERAAPMGTFVIQGPDHPAYVRNA